MAVLVIQVQLSSDTKEIVIFSSITLGKASCTIPSFINTALERNISSPVLAQTAAMVVVLCAGEPTTVILTLAMPNTGILVLFAAPSVRLDGDNCSLSHPMAVLTNSLMTQFDAPVLAR